MEMLLIWIGSGLSLLLAVAVGVTWCEMARAAARVRCLRETTQLLQTLAWPQAAPARPVDMPVEAAPTAPTSAAESRQAVLVGTTRRVARPAVGHPCSGWTETEPMVLAGPSHRHFDPTELTPH